MKNGDLGSHPADRLAPFFGLTFAITWGLALVIVLFPNFVAAVFGELSAYHPLFVLAVWGPTLAAVVLTWRGDGAAGVRRLVAMLFRWRFGWRWYLFLLVGIPLVGIALATVGTAQPAMEITSISMLVGLFAILLVTGPLGEELGWRGYALPRLLRRTNALTASLVIGLVWGVWHLPAFFMAGLPQEGLAIPAFLVMSLGLSVIATWVYLRTGRSVLAVVLFHYAVNLCLSVIGSPLTLFMLACAAGAAIVVAIDRRIAWFRGAGPDEALATAGNTVLAPVIHPLPEFEADP